MIVHEVEQNTPEWHALRLGIPTASEFATVMARTPGGKAYGATRQKYMRKLAGERITGLPAENYRNGFMDRGHEQEDEARTAYAFTYGGDVQRVGFVTADDGTRGASPDSFIGADGVLEIKTKTADLLIDEIERERVPPEHMAQCQGQVWVCEREWCDLALYCPALPLVRHRVYRDEEYIARLADEVARFNDELAALVEKVKNYGAAA